MAKQFSMNGADAREAGQDMVADGVTLMTAHRVLSDTLDRLHGAWGKDDFGKAFEENLAGQLDELRDNTGTLAENYKAIGEAVGGIVTAFDETDEENAEKLDGLQAENISTWVE